MAMATPTFRLTGTGGTVILECKHAADPFKRPTKIVPIEVRKKLDSDEDGGFTNVVKSFYTLAGQTQNTQHRMLTAEQDALLSAWAESLETLSYQWPGGTHNVIIQTYEAQPRNRLFQHSNVVVENLTLLFV